MHNDTRKINGYAKYFDEAKCINFFDWRLWVCLEMYNKIWQKINTYFTINNIPKEVVHCVWLPMILMDSVFKTDKNYYPDKKYS